MLTEPIFQLSIILPNEQQILVQLNDTNRFSSDSLPYTVHESFARQAQINAQKVALELEAQSVTYSELLHAVQLLMKHLSDKVQPTEIVCQCVQRSIEMVIGLLAIISSGAIYCPLSPLDPPTRIISLVQDTGANTVLVHTPTRQQIVEVCTSSTIVNIDSIFVSDKVDNNNDDDDLKPVLLMPDNIAYIIFTSGTSGTPKAVTISHFHFLHYLQSSVEVDALRSSDNAVQLSSCMWDVHLHEILGTIFVGGTVVLLHPEQDNRNMDYLSRVIEVHQVTYVCIVPTLQTMLFDIVQAQQALHRLRTLRLLWSVGK
jgi:non-ribosomal peptide synthetase component F